MGKFLCASILFGFILVNNYATGNDDFQSKHLGASENTHAREGGKMVRPLKREASPFHHGGGLQGLHHGGQFGVNTHGGFGGIHRVAREGNSDMYEKVKSKFGFGENHRDLREGDTNMFQKASGIHPLL